MAFSVVKLHTGTNTKTSGSTLTATLTSNVPSGNALLFAIVHDNVQQSPDSTPNPPAGVARLNTTNPPSAGVYTALWVGTGNTSSETTGGLYYAVSDGSSSFNSGATFTFTVYNSVSVAAKVLSVVEVSGLDLTSRYEVAIPGASVATTYSRNLTSPAADYVHFFLVGTENNAAPTLDSDLTQIDAIATTGGGAASNVGLAWGYNDPNSTATFTYSGTVSDGGWASMAIKVASTGPQTYQVTGTIPVTSGVSGSPTFTLNVTGTSAATVAVSGAPTYRLGVSGTSAATSTVAGEVAAIKTGMAGTVPVISGVAGDFTVKQPTVYQVTGTVSVVSGVSGSPYMIARGLTGTVAVLTTVAGDIYIVGVPVTYQVTGTVPVVSGVTGAISGRFKLDGVNACLTAVSGTPTYKLALAGVVPVVSGVSGSPAGRFQVSGTVPVVSDVQGLISIAGTSLGGFWGIHL